MTWWWDFQQCGMCDQQSLRSACAYAQSDQSFCLSLEYSMSVKLPTEHHLKYLILKGGCTGSSKSPLVKMLHCWKSRVTAQMAMMFFIVDILFQNGLPKTNAPLKSLGSRSEQPLPLNDSSNQKLFNRLGNSQWTCIHLTWVGNFINRATWSEKEI